MEYQRLGRSGLLVAPLALGTDNFVNPTPEAEAVRIIDRALDALRGGLCALCGAGVECLPARDRVEPGAAGCG